jgi:hypothetical protein
MPPLGQRQVYGIFVLLVALAAIVSIDRAVVPYAGALAALSVIIVVWSGGATSGASLAGLREAVDRARSGKVPDPPPGAPPEVTDIYGALGRIAEALSELGERAQKREREIEEATTQVSDALRRIARRK